MIYSITWRKKRRGNIQNREGVVLFFSVHTPFHVLLYPGYTQKQNDMQSIL